MSTSPARPRHARKEVRDFADWLVAEGWEFDSVDASGHSIWTHPDASAPYKLPETPRAFNVRRARRDVYKLLGIDVSTKRQARRAKEQAAARRQAEADEQERRHREDMAARARARRMEDLNAEIHECREACFHAGKALRNDPGNPRLRAHFDRLRAQLAAALRQANAD